MLNIFNLCNILRNVKLSLWAISLTLTELYKKDEKKSKFLCNF